MAYQSSPVSRVPLKRLEFKTAASNKLFIANQNAGRLSLTLQQQNMVNTTQKNLILVIHNDEKPLITVRLSDVLRNSEAAANIISTNIASLVLFVNIPYPSYTLSAYFDDIREFHLAVYLLERTGFRINTTLHQLTCSTNPTVSRTGSGNIAPIRLSSITPLQSQSQPELYPTQTSSFGDSNAHAVSDNHPLQRTESIPFQAFDAPYSPFQMPAIQGELNPYKHFVSHQGTSAHSQAHNLLPSIALRDRVVPSAVSQTSPWESLFMATQDERTAQLPPKAYAVPAPGPLMGTIKLNIEQLDASSLAKEADFRLFMPQTRSLPFQNSAHRTIKRSKGEPKLTASKGKNPTDSISEASDAENAKETPPAKRRSANKRKKLVDKKLQPKNKRCKSQPDSMSIPENVPVTELIQRATPRAAPKSKTTNITAAPTEPAAKKTQEKPSRKAALSKKSLRKASPLKPQTQKLSTKVPPKKKQEKEKPPMRKEVKKISEVSPSSKRSKESVSIDAKSRKKRTTRTSRANLMPTSESNSAQGCSDQQVPRPAEVIENLHSQKEVTRSISHENEFNSTLVVAEPKMLDALNKMTWNILSQYEADLESGSNRFEVAQFYVDSMYDTRFAFWFAKLKKLGGLDARHIREPVF